MAILWPHPHVHGNPTLFLGGGGGGGGRGQENMEIRGAMIFNLCK